MEDKMNQVNEKINKFFYKAFEYYGKEIALESNQYFSIDQIVDEEKQQQGEYQYRIQYGYPSSGCVSMKFCYSEKNDSGSITEVTVDAPPADKEMIIATFAPQSQINGIKISANFGLDMGTVQHKSLSAIANNPNALKMIDIAISDLCQAEILGECGIVVPADSNLIPCSNSTNKPYNKGKSV